MKYAKLVTEVNQRKTTFRLTRSQLESLIIDALMREEFTETPLNKIRTKVAIEENMEGSPSYRNGYRAVVEFTEERE